MSKGQPIAGKDLMIFINGKATALATSHSLNLNADTSDAASKDDGRWKRSKITKMGFEMTTEALVSANPEVDSFDAMYDLFVAGEEVDVVSGRPSNITDDGVPEEGWTAPTTNYYKGKALITSLQKNDPNNENSTMTISLLGNGKLERVEA